MRSSGPILPALFAIAGALAGAPPALDASSELPESLSKLPVLNPAPATAPSPGTATWTTDFEYEHGLWMVPQGKTFRSSFASAQASWSTSDTTDPQGRRVPPWQNFRKQTAKRHVFFFGDALTYGQGVNDPETFAAKISMQSPDLITYNAGMGGYGPSEHIQRARTTALLDAVTPAAGVGVYVMFAEHVRRYLNTTDLVATWRPNGLAVSENGDGALEILGPVRESAPVWYYFSLAWNRLTSWSLPRVTDARIDEFFRAVAALRDLYRARTRTENPFAVVLFPYPEDSSPLRAGLERAGLPYVDYTRVDVRRHLAGPEHLPGDSHPSVELHEKLAAALAADLRPLLDGSAR